MTRATPALLALFFIAGCGESPEPAPPMPTEAEALAAAVGVEPTDYTKADHWICTGDSGDLCDDPDGMAVITTDGTILRRPWRAADDPGVDCFYIYPTVDLTGGTRNHDDLADDLLPRAVVRTQAAPFGEVCRVFAPLYRQAVIGNYLVGDAPEALASFRKAFIDVAAAFEYYMRTWNEGRPVVLIGHSQGAQMATYLLHRWFDGDRPLRGIPGVATTAELRERLIVGLPIGFNVFVPKGKRVGGSFADLPLCAEPGEQGCVIHYRSYPEGYDRGVGAGGALVDRALAAEGWLHAVFDDARHMLACVNPARGTLRPGELVIDPLNDAPVTDTAETRVIGESWFWGPALNLMTGWATTPRDQAFPRRYTATCRKDQLAIGLLAGPIEDIRGDPADIASADGALGLHGYDFSLLHGDLVADIRTRAAARSQP